MSLSYNSSKAVFEGNGLSKVFPFNFKIWETEQVLVFITDPMGYDSQATDFKVELLDEGGSVTYLHQDQALPAGYKLTILRNMPFEQRIDLISGTRFDPQVIEEQLDQATAERQQLLEAVERSVKILPSDNIKPEELVQNIYKARDKAVESAGEALISEENSKQSELEAINQVILGQQILDNTIQEGLNAQNNIAIDKDKALQALKEQEINSINSVIAEGEQQIDLATKQAQRAENEADRAKIEADRAEAVVDLEFGTGLEFVAKKLTVKLSDALDLDDSETAASAKAAKLLNDKDISLDANIIELQNSLSITNNNVTIAQNTANDAKLITDDVSITPEAHKIPRALADGKIAIEWIPDSPIPAFSVTKGNFSMHSAVTKHPFDTVLYDNMNGYSASLYEYTIKKAGLYHLNFYIYMIGTDHASPYVGYRFYINGKPYYYDNEGYRGYNIHDMNYQSKYCSFKYELSIPLNINDKISVYTNGVYSAILSSFSGYLI